jgi:O-antigen ligase
MFLVSVIGQKYGDIAFLRKDGCVRPLLDVIIFTASVISAYIIIQFLGYDQFFKVVPFYGSVPNGACGGTLGHPLFVGTFLAMAIPSAIYRRKYVHLALIAFSICLTVSQMSICALVCCVLAYYALTSKKRLVWCVLTGVIIAVLSVFAYFKYDKVRYFVGDGARFSTWTNIVKDLNTSPLEGIKKAYPMTGNGIGSFPVMYHNKYKGENIAKMLHADGEYFELLYEIGIIGFLLLVMAFVSLFRKHRFTEYSAFVYSSLIASMVGAFGVYSWHLGAHIFYTLFFIGLAESGGQHGT